MHPAILGLPWASRVQWIFLDGALVRTCLNVVPAFSFRVLTELVSKMRDMQMDKTELGCLRAIVLFNPGTALPPPHGQGHTSLPVCASCFDFWGPVSPSQQTLISCLHLSGDSVERLKWHSMQPECALDISALQLSLVGSTVYSGLLLE